MISLFLKINHYFYYSSLKREINFSRFFLSFFLCNFFKNFLRKSRPVKASFLYRDDRLNCKRN